jgi:hypothetical protein
MAVGGEPAHVRADLGDQALGGAPVHPGNSVSRATFSAKGAITLSTSAESRSTVRGAWGSHVPLIHGLSAPGARDVDRATAHFHRVVVRCSA